MSGFSIYRKYLIMTPFEYVTVLISIILGLGIANRYRHWWWYPSMEPHQNLLAARPVDRIGFVMHIHEWWYTYELKKHDSGTFVFLFLILYPILLFCWLAYSFLSNMDTDVDFKVFYFNNYRKFFLLVSLLVVLAILQDMFWRVFIRQPTT